MSEWQFLRPSELESAKYMGRERPVILWSPVFPTISTPSQPVLGWSPASPRAVLFSIASLPNTLPSSGHPKDCSFWVRGLLLRITPVVCTLDRLLFCPGECLSTPLRIGEVATELNPNRQICLHIFKVHYHCHHAGGLQLWV